MPVSDLRSSFLLPTLAAVPFLLGGRTARAATIEAGDVTAALGPAFFVDDAATGGGDSPVITQPNVAGYNRSFAGLLTSSQGMTRVTLNGFGFATSNSPANNTATSLTVTFTYLGADGAVGGGDDVPMGSATGSYAFTTNSEYVFAFDTPITSDLDITGTRFQIQVAPSNGTNNGKVLLKTAALTYETSSGPKFSVSGIAAPQRVNLAKYQTVLTDSISTADSGQRLASYVTDGVAGNDNRWESRNVPPHWAQVVFPHPVEVGGAQVFSGVDDGNALTEFKLQYLDGSTWVDVPGASVSGNTSVENNIVFTSPVTASSFRIYDSVDSTMRLRELALYPPNGATGFALGTDVGLNLARQRPVVSNANTAGNFALLAVDGRVNKDSIWQTSTAGTNWLEIDLIAGAKIGSAHVYSGSPGIAPLTDFVLKYWDGSAWQNIPGGIVAANTTADLALSFTPVTTSKVRLEFTNPGTASLRELCVFPANSGNTGYPIGTGVTGAPPSTAKFDDYTDSFYQITSPAAGIPLAVGGNGQPVLSEPGLGTDREQYQIILNIGTGTYRLRNRATGNCLSGAQLSKSPGEPLTDAPYSALPHQDWILDPLDGGTFQFINQWSGLVIDVQGGGTAAGTPLVQNTANGSASQRWQAVFSAGFPKKGVGGGSFAKSFNADWMYGWGLTTSATLPAGAVFHPMQWGNFNWTFNTSAPSTWKLYPTWRTTSEPLQLMGFNEPDAFSQSGNSLDTENTNEADFSSTRAMEKAVELWPRLQAMDQPLVAPCPANMTGGWLADFYTRANAQGYRVDYTAKHSYGSPNNGSSDNLVNGVLEGYTLWGKPMWLTEFSFVDWGENSSWSEEDTYNCLAEFLWRAESLPWLRKYALFVFTEDANNPQPANPWQDFTPAPRSNARDINGNLTAFGKLYAAWDNDAVVRTDKTYYIHNKNTRKRLANNTAQSNAAARNIRTDGPLVQWTLVSAGPANRYFVVSSLDGRRLSTDGTTVSLVASDTTGTNVEWSLAVQEHGWFFLGHPASSKRLKMAYNNSGFTATYSMVANTSTGDDVQWRFIVPPPTPAWSGVVGDSWTDAANWSPAIVPANGDAVTFNNSSTANLATVLDQDFSLSGISLTDPAAPVSIDGTNALTIGANGIDLSEATRNLTLNAPSILSAAQSWTVASGRTLSLGGTISGAFDVTLAGAGHVSLNASNVLPNGVAAGNLIVNGTLDLNGTAQSINGLGGSGIVDNTSGAGILTIGNNDINVALGGTLQNTAGTLALVKTGAGTLTLNTANSFSGGFTNNGSGNVFPKNDASFGTGPVTMQAATLYATGGSYTFANALTLDGATLRVGGGAGRSIAWTGPVTVTAESGIHADGSTSGITLSGALENSGVALTSFANGTANTISGSISGTGSITVTSGTLNLNAANSFSGSFRSTTGILKIGDANALQNATLDMNAADAGSVNLSNLSATIGALTGSRNLTLGSGTVSIGNNHADTTYSGVLGGSGSLIKTGSGTLALAGVNNYAGATNVNAGTLRLEADGMIPSNTPVSVKAGATLDTSAKPTYIVPSTFAFGIDATAAGSSGRIAAAGLAIGSASVTYNITGTPDDPVYVLATYTSLSGSYFASAPAPPAGYALDYAYQGNKIALVQATSSPYQVWAGTAPFNNDNNGDGVKNGMAWLLGAADPDANVPGIPQVGSQSGGDLILTFTCLKVAHRGDAVLKLQYSKDLGIADQWTIHESLVPDAAGSVGGVTFSVPSVNADPKLVNLRATIPASTASPGTKLFGRLSATP